MRRGLLFITALCACDNWTEGTDGLTDTDHFLVSQMVLPATPPPDPTNTVANPFNPRNAAAVHLGQQLFYDTTLSNPPGVSCATCHDPRFGFMDPRTPNLVSQGVSADGGTNFDGSAKPPIPQFTKRNSLGLFDVAYYAWWGWDGRSDSLWMQCGVAFEAGATMAGKRPLLMQALQDNSPPRFYASEYVALFGAFDGGTDGTAANAYKAMAAYLTQLVRYDAPFDLYAAGDDGALGPDAIRGLKLFIGEAGCISCHAGPAFNGATVARSDEDYFRTVGVGQRGDHVPMTDDGRYSGVYNLVDGGQYMFNTHGLFNDTRGLDRVQPFLNPDGGAPLATATDKGRFRIKGLRNVSLTAPYMHAGQLATLDDVVHFYNGGGDDSAFLGTRDRQLKPLGLSETQMSDLVSFLESLTGPTVNSALLCDPVGPVDGGNDSAGIKACPCDPLGPMDGGVSYFGLPRCP